MNPECMNPDCKKSWSFDFISDNFPKKFYNNKYRIRRAELMYEKEKSLLPSTQPLLQEIKDKEKLKEKIKKLRSENIIYREIVKSNKNKIHELENQIFNRISYKTEKAKFVRACPSPECRGFLSSALKCGTCDIWACKDCHEIKGIRQDSEHKCDPNTVETMKLLAQDTKPCPSCGEGITKLVGCQQMYCTMCNKGFDWKSGKIITNGRLHNPHYFEFLAQQNKGVAPRSIGDVRCGGDPSYHSLDTKLRNISKKIFDFPDILRLLRHIRAIELPRYNIDNTDHSDLRIKVLLNKINDKKWISNLKKRMKAREKHISFNHILSMFVETLSDLLRNIVGSPTRQGKMDTIDSIKKLRIYVNKNLQKIGETFENVYPCVNDFWEYDRNAMIPWE